MEKLESREANHYIYEPKWNHHIGESECNPMQIPHILTSPTKPNVKFCYAKKYATQQAIVIIIHIYKIYKCLATPSGQQE